MGSLCFPVAIKEHLVQLYQDGRTATAICAATGISRQTLYKWLRRYEREGAVGLHDQSRRPHHCPTRISEGVEQAILFLRQKERVGPARIALRLKLSVSTVYRVLKTHSLNQLHPKLPKKICRYEKDYPGQLLHLDIKDLVPLWQGAPKEYQFAAIDDFSREGFSLIYPCKDSRSATDFLQRTRAFYSYPVEAVLTDNALVFTMRYAYHPNRFTLFEKTCQAYGIRHLRLKPYHPQSNGKVERFFRTVQEECYNTVRLKSSQHREQVLQEFLVYYNQARPHLGIKGLTPIQKRKLYFQTVSDVSD